MGFLGQGMSCCLQSALAAASSWACREVMPGTSSLNLAAAPAHCSESPTLGTRLHFVSQSFGAPDLCGLRSTGQGGLSEARAHTCLLVDSCSAFRQILVQISAPLCPRLSPQKEMLRCRLECEMFVWDQNL